MFSFCAAVASAAVILLLGSVLLLNIKHLLDLLFSDFSFVIATKETKRLGRNDYTPFLPYSYMGLLCYCGFGIGNSTLRIIQFAETKTTLYFFLVTFCLPPDIHRGRRQVTKKGPAIEYGPMAEGSLIRLQCYCGFNGGNSTLRRTRFAENNAAFRFYGFEIFLLLDISVFLFCN